MDYLKNPSGEIKTLMDDFKVVKAHLNAGDFSISYRKYLLALIERKTLPDLAATIKDPKRKANVNKMLKKRSLVEARNITKCKIFYIIEGKPFPKHTRRFGRIPYSNLMAHLDHLMLRDDIHVIYSSNLEYTIKRVLWLAKHISTLEPSPLKSINDHVDHANQEEIKGGKRESIDDEKALTIHVKAEDAVIMESIWTSVPYITSKSAHLFKKFKIKDLLLGKIPEADISMLRYNSGVSIGTRVKKICSIANNPKIFSTILAAVPLISKGTADHLLTQISMERLLNLTNTPENLDMIADLRRSEKRRLGPAAAGNIWKFLLEFE